MDFGPFNALLFVINAIIVHCSHSLVVMPTDARFRDLRSDLGIVGYFLSHFFFQNIKTYHRSKMKKKIIMPRNLSVAELEVLLKTSSSFPSKFSGKRHVSICSHFRRWLGRRRRAILEKSRDAPRRQTINFCQRLTLRPIKQHGPSILYTQT